MATSDSLRLGSQGCGDAGGGVTYIRAVETLILIHGSEDVIAERALREISEANSESERTVIDCTEAEVGAISEAMAPSLFSEKRLIVIKNLQELDSESHAEVDRYLADPDPSNVVVFLHRGGVKGKGLVDRIKKRGVRVILAEPLKKSSDRMAFIREEFQRLGRKISPEALSSLVAGFSDMRELTSVARQLSQDVPQGKVIDEDAVANMTQGRRITTGFEVADAVIAKDPRKALLSTRQAFDSGVEPMAIFSAVKMSIISMLKVIDIPRGAKSFEVAGELAMAPWQIDKARRQLAGWREEDFDLALNEIVRADWAVKGGEGHPQYAVERMVLAIASSGRLVRSPDQSTAWRKS